MKLRKYLHFICIVFSYVNWYKFCNCYLVLISVFGLGIGTFSFVNKNAMADGNRYERQAVTFD